MRRGREGSSRSDVIALIAVVVIAIVAAILVVTEVIGWVAAHYWVHWILFMTFSLVLAYSVIALFKALQAERWTIAFVVQVAVFLLSALIVVSEIRRLVDWWAWGRIPVFLAAFAGLVFCLDRAWRCWRSRAQNSLLAITLPAIGVVISLTFGVAQVEYAFSHLVR